MVGYLAVDCTQSSFTHTADGDAKAQTLVSCCLAFSHCTQYAVDMLAQLFATILSADTKCHTLSDRQKSQLQSNNHQFRLCLTHFTENYVDVPAEIQ